MSKTQIPSLPIANLQQYTQLVERIPLLDDTEERELAERLRRHNDLDAARRLVTSHLRYVVFIAKSYRGYGLPQEDLIQEGNIGLMKAVRRFDPSRGVRLIAYAAYWIRAQIHDFILRNWRIVKVATTKAKRKLFYKLRSAKQRLEWLDKSEASRIAGALDVAPEDVVEMEAKLYLHDEPFDAHAADTDDDAPAPAAYLADCRFEPQSVITETQFVGRTIDALDAALSKLDPRSRDIIEKRWFADEGAALTLHDLGRRYHISAERVRQLELAAIKRLRGLIAPRVGVDHCEVGLPRCRAGGDHRRTRRSLTRCVSTGARAQAADHGAPARVPRSLKKLPSNPRKTLAPAASLALGSGPRGAINPIDKQEDELWQLSGMNPGVSGSSRAKSTACSARSTMATAAA